VERAVRRSARLPLTIRVHFDGKLTGEAKAQAAERGSVVVDKTIALTAPDVVKPMAMRARLELRGANDALVAENYIELFIYPDPTGPDPKKRNGAAYLAGGLATMAEALRGAGYNIAPSPDKQSVIVTDKLDQQIRDLISSGHRAIVLANDKDALPSGAIKITPRNGSTGYDGNWVTNFNWVNVNRAPFNAVAFDKLPGFEAEAVTPKFVIEGVKAEEYDDVMSGIFLGWVNKNAALMIGAHRGEGRAIITTFRLADAYGKDQTEK
jgi:hypothetical protein